MYLIFFIGGFVIISNERLQERIRKDRWVSLALGLALLGTLMGMGIRAAGHPAFEPTFEEWNDTLACLSAWALILGFMGLAWKYLNFTNPFLKYSNEAVLPFYILHQTVLLCVGFFVVRWPIPDPAKWLLITAVSFAMILGIYEYLVRRSILLRFLFGMKGKETVREAAPALREAKA